MGLPVPPRVITRISPLVATQARRRMAVVVATALLFSVFTVSGEVILPLWVTRDLGLAPSQWAQLRSLRMTGVLVGVILLGALSDRFGQRLVGALSMLGVAAVLVALGLGWGMSIWVAMPFYGALVSTAFVNLNTLTQQVSDRRQGLANSIYRSVGAAAGIGAPVLATRLALVWHGYPPVFLALAGVLVVAAVVLLRYPGEPTPPPLGNLRAEVRRLWEGYRAALRERELVRVICYSQTWGNVLAGVGIFAAIRFTRELGLTDQQFGLLSGTAGAVTLLASVSLGLFLDRVSLRKLHFGVALVASACSVLMGLGNSVLLGALGFVLSGPLCAMLSGPVSMWVSRAAGKSSQTAAFTVHKVLSGLYLALTSALLGLLETWIGMRAIFLYGGLAGVVASFLFLALREPPPPELGARLSVSE